MNGGCHCGAVRYRLRDVPTDIGWCHCRDCQLNSASPAMPFANLAANSLTIERGEDRLVDYASSEHVRRRFCGSCGTPLFVVDAREDEQPAVNMVTLDTPADLPPTYHIYYASHIPWAAACDDLPRFARSSREEAPS